MIKRTNKYSGFLKVLEVEGINSRGTTVKREIMSRATGKKSDDCVAGLLYDKERDLYYMTEQYRAGAKEEDRYLLEVVAGTLEVDEDPVECFKRESMEEVGFECDDIHYVGCFYTSPGGTTERIYMYVADGTRTQMGGGLESENEDIVVKSFTYDEMVTLIEEDKIKDLKTRMIMMYI